MRKNTLGLLYLGRMEKEKGFDLILEYIKGQKEALPFEIYIFGKGSLETKLLDLQKQKSQIHFFGRKPLEEVERYLENIDYCLMPSKCLETFGLSAVNVLDRGIPVIGFKKGGLKPFIREEYNIASCKGENDQEKFCAMMERLIDEKSTETPEFYQNLAQECKTLAQSYSKDKRFEQFQSMVFDFRCKKIVLVNDFMNPIGGIETYLHEVRPLLISKGYQVKVFGSKCPSGLFGKLKKYLGLGISLFNIREAIRLRKFIKKEQPDLIWFHNMIRREGWLPISLTSSSKAQKRAMYHDLGYFHPYPSKTKEENEIKNLTLISFLRMAKTRNPLKLVLVTGKWISIKLLAHTLKKNIDQHLVPSSFMIPIVKRNIEVSLDNIKSFAHFVQK